MALKSAGEDDRLRLCSSIGDDSESETELMGLIWKCGARPRGEDEESCSTLPVSR